MALFVEDCLQTLHGLLKQPSSSAKEQIGDAIEDIKRVFLDEITEKDIDLACSLLFDKEKGILCFLHKTVTVEEIQNGKASALDFLSLLIERMDKKILPFSSELKEISVSLYSRDHYAKVKNAAVYLLVKLIKVCAGSSHAENLKVDQLIPKFFTELTKGSKISASVQANIYRFLGVIAEVYPDLMAVYSERLVGLYVNALKKEMMSKTKKPELSIVAGCLDGLTALMVNFTQSADEDAKYSYEIFKYMRMAIDPSVTYTRYEVPNAGLKLIARHAEQFKPYLLDDYQAMYKKLDSWSRHHNRDVLHLGLNALTSFVKEICAALVDKAQKGEMEGAVFKFFLMNFRNVMKDKDSTTKLVSMAITGYGMLAAPCRSFLSESDTQFMLSEVIAMCEHRFLSPGADIEEHYISLPNYLKALANIIRQLDSVSIANRVTLEHLLILLLEGFPSVSQSQQHFYVIAWIRLMLTLAKKASFFHTILNETVYQSLIRTCSFPTSYESTQTQSQKSDTVQNKSESVICYKDFVPFWKGLLNSTNIKELAGEDFIIAERQNLVEGLYNEIIGSVLKILSKLDMEASQESSDEGADESMEMMTTSDPIYGIAAKTPVDFRVLINMVDLARDILVDNHCNLFHPWVYTFCHTLIVMATRNPLVSGLYKLLTVAVTVSRKINFFKGLGENVLSTPLSQTMDEKQPSESKEKMLTIELLKRFSKEVLIRMKQFKDDILASCLTLILAMPKEIISDLMADIVPALQVTFAIGLSYLPLALVGLEALESWKEHLPSSLLEPYYAEILPCLDAYLQSDENVSEEAPADSAVVVNKTSRRKVPLKLLKEKKKALDKLSSESLLSKVKRRILIYLGSLGGSCNHHLLAHTDKITSEEAVAWDSKQHLRFDVPFFDMKPTIYFDPFLPRVVHLAQTSSDRPTKTAACELLHSLTLYAVGRGVQMPGDTQQRYPMEHLYQKLFPPLLNLACDVEQICQDLFQPLMMQLIHWFTGNKMAESPETMALLDAIYDGLIQQSNMALRDFSAKCLKEFLSWSMKQISQKSAKSNPVNAKSVLKRMFSFSLHPNSSKRLGAALAFNNIYMVFREENGLVDRFTFDILVHFVESLAMAHKDPKYLGTEEQCNSALHHLERIITVKADLLKSDPGEKRRPEPSFWSNRTLENGVRWLTRQCGRPETQCRHMCMKLVHKLSTLLPGMKSPSDYFGVLFKNGGARYFIERFEGGGDGSNGLLACPTLHDETGSMTLSRIMDWFDNLLAVLDCYCWLFDQALLSPLQMFTGKGSEKSSIFKSLIFFLDEIAQNGIEDLGAIFFEQTEVIVFTPLEIEEFSRGKCTVIIRLWNFLTILLRKHAGSINKFVPSDFWCDKLWVLLADCIMCPHSVGFKMADTEVILMLPKEMNQVLMMIDRFLPDLHKKNFSKCLRNHLSTECNLTTLLPVNLQDNESDKTRLMYLVEGYKQLQEVSSLANNLPGLEDKAHFAKSLLDNVFSGIVQEEEGAKKMINLSPTSKTLANSMLTLALCVGIPTKNLMNLMLDKSKIQSNCQEITVCRGDLFFSCLRPALLDYLVSSKRDEISSICSMAHMDSESVCAILEAVLDHVGRNKILRKNKGMSLCNTVLGQWKKLECMWNRDSTPQTQKLALGILTKILLIDSQVASNENHQFFPVVFEMYISLLTNRKSPMSLKNESLALMPFFASVTKGNEEKLKDALNQFVADTFPLKSSEFKPGSTNYKDYISAINKLLVAMEMTGSHVLLELIISIMCKEQSHYHELAMQESVGKLIQRLPSANQKPAIDVAYNIFTKEECFASDIRRAAVEKVCLHMLQLATTASVIEFFSDHIIEMMTHLDAKMKTVESVLEVQLTNKIAIFQLLERMFSRLSKDEVNSKISTINMKYCQGKVETGKEMTMKITRAAQEAKSEDVRGDNTLRELRRQYHCHAYNLLIAIISCVQTEIKFYRGFLFQDNPAKGQFLLDNIICQAKGYEFTVEFQVPLQQHKKFLSLRKEVKEEQRIDVKEEFESSTPSLHLASQYLAESSLSEDLNQYDFNQQSSAQSKESNISADILVLEMDALNEHECMAPVIGLIRHMQRVGISPQVPKGDVPKEMPVWMTYFHEKMSQASMHINCKLFIAKVIINCSQIFQPYAKWWFMPLFELLFQPEMTNQGINYFTVDLIVTMLSWQTVAIPQEKSMVSRLVRQFVCRIHHENRQVFRNNLDLFNALLEHWHPNIEIPYNDIYNYLKESDPQGTPSVIGLQVLGVVVSNKFDAFGPSASVGRERYFHVLCKLMNHRLKPVHAASAEILGMVLYKAAQKDKALEESLSEQVFTHLSAMAQERGDNFIVCAHKIHSSYSSIPKSLVSKLLFILPNLNGELRSKCLEILKSCINDMENAYEEFVGKGLMNYLSHRDEEIQLTSLQIVQILMAKLDKKQMNSLMGKIVSFTTHPSLSCRKVMLNILMWIFDNYKDDEDERSLEIMMMTKEALLKGLCDEEPECRLSCQNFWSSNVRLSEGTLDRTVSLLEAMYSKSTENHFLAYATSLLLESTSKSPDYQRLVFEHPLSECKFQDYSVQSSWHQRHSAMTPLFAVTLASQTQDSFEDDPMDGEVRATMEDPQFSQTVDGSGRPFNWLTQSSLDTYAESGSLKKDSHLLFTIGADDSVSPKSKVRGATHSGTKTFALKSQAKEQGTSSQAHLAEDSKSSDIWRLKKRFLKDKQTQAAFYSRRQARVKKMEEYTILQRKAQRENKVTLYRKYRIGDLPDIQIKYQYIIAPLQALADKDNTVASLLFSSLFKAVLAEIDTVKTERQKAEVIEQIKKSVENILLQTVHYFPPFISSIMDILYHLKTSLQVSPNDITTCAILSGQQNLGILLLEEQLIQMGNTQEPSSKRARTGHQNVDSPDAARWIELCRLFKSIHEYDALQGILNDRMGTKKLTRQAIEAEARGDYKAARQVYEEATSCLVWQDGDPTEYEVDFWDEGRMKCLNYLCQWQDLETVSVTGVDSSEAPNLERVWDDPFYQDHFLPYVIRSKLKLLVEGNEHQQAFLSFVDQAMEDADRKQHLQSRYSHELALLSLWQGDYNRARHFAGLSFDKFLQDWMSITPMMALSREDNLCHLQTLVEIHEFLEVVSSEDARLKLLHQRWHQRLPHDLLNPVPVWDDIATNRSVYMGILSQHQDSQPGTSKDQSSSFEPEVKGLVGEMQTNLWLIMAKSCIQQNNFALALKLLKKTNAICNKLGNPLCSSLWTITYSLTHHSKALSNPHPWSGEVFNNVVSTIDQLEKSRKSKLQTRQDYNLWTHILIGKAFDILTQGLMGLDSVDDLDEGILKKISTHVSVTDRSQLIRKSIKTGFEYLKSATDLRPALPQGTQSVIGVEQASLDLAKYCEKYQQLLDEKQLSDDQDMDLFPLTIVECLLTAIRGGSLEARERFPSLLQLVGQHPQVRNAFVSETQKIPSWMFLMWLSQMTALMDEPEGVVIIPILERVAKEYPQALVYPFTMSFDEDNFGKGSSLQERDMAEKVKRIAEQVNIPIIKKFTLALEQFTQPFMMFKDWADEMRKLLNDKNKNKKKIQSCYRNIYAALIMDKSQASIQSEDTQLSLSCLGGMGIYRKNFSTLFKGHVDKAFGVNAEKLSTMSVNEFNKAFKSLEEHSRNQSKKLTAPNKLKDYSPWMADFTLSKHGKHLEIPGQYCGRKKPLPEYHVYVTGFAERVLVLSSLRQPKRITIRGNDEKDHPYMVKGGEDLRLDQRIQNLFYIMNKVMRSDSACCQRKLQLMTYQVIPMSPRLGLIQWLNNTCVLKDFLTNALTADEKKSVEGEKGPQRQHMVWMSKANPSKKILYEMYDEAYRNYSSKETIREFRNKEAKLPWDLSRRALKQMSASSTAFLVLRNRLVTSHATICICQYLLGIGDRHLGNFMVSNKTGHMIGIDFGHAFGTATQFLPIPELMPFRLTCQLSNLTLPMKVKGQMDGTMRHVLQALRNDCSLLLSTMDVFIKEPSIDWQIFAERQIKQLELSEDLTSEKNWYPKMKVEIAKRKLEGDHPSYIMRDELESSTLRKRPVALKKYTEVLIGSKEQVRTQLSQNKLTVEDQVAALIDQATDPNILGRVYVGWSPWM